MNSFIENVNYVAGLDNLYGSGIELYKNNLSLKSVQHDIELKFSYYNNDDKKIHSIVHSEPGVLVGGINDTLLSFKTLVESSITGSEFTCTVSSSVQDFVINNIVMVNINITSNSDTYKTYELEMKVVTAGAVTYDVFGEVKDSLKILPSLATITASDIDAIVNVYEIQEDVITVSENIVNVETVSDSIANVNTVGISITNVNIVGEDIVNVNTVSTHISNVDTVSESITNVNTVGSNIVDVGIASTNIASINTVANAQNLADIIRVADDLNSLDVNGIADITIVANDLVLGVNSNIITVSESIDNVNITGNDIDNVNTVGINITDIGTVSTNIENVNITANDISSVNNVSLNIADVNTVSDGITNVNIVSGSIANVNTVATNIVGLNSIVSNITEILLADDNAAIATTKALESSDSAASALSSKDSATASATSADVSASEALVSATNAATSATNASTSAIQSATSAVQSANSASSANASAVSASSSASEALTSKNSATASASAALASKNAAKISETNASVSEGNALNSANNATTKASEASTSATNASNSATSASNSASAASISETNAGNSEDIAITKAGEALASANNASASEANALVSKNSASTSASTATAQATISVTKAADAVVSADNALASENKAEKWATELEGVAVEPGKYSAMHWAIKAQSFAEGDAVNIVYDGTTSGLSSINVQDAIDELDDNLDTLTSNVYTKQEVRESLPVIGLSVSAGTVVGAGQIAWNADEGTADLGLNGGSVLQIGQENIRTIRNGTAGIIANGTLCMFNGTIGNSGRIKAKPFTAGFNEAMYLYGVATQNITSGSDGIITIEGKVRGIDTTGTSVGEVWHDEDILYAKPNDNGRMTNIMPADNELKLVVATVIHAHTSGTLEIRFTPFNENMYYTKVQNDILLSNKVPLNSDFILDLGEI